MHKLDKSREEERNDEQGAVTYLQFYASFFEEPSILVENKHFLRKQETREMISEI